MRTNQGKTGARVRVHAAAHQEENDNTGKKERQEKNSRLILERLGAARLRSFRGQHSEKMTGCGESPG